MSSSGVVSSTTDLRSTAMDPMQAGGRVEPVPMFLPDTLEDDGLGREDAARNLADLLGHRAAGTPFLMALVGAAGSGKSSFLRMIFGRLPGPTQPARDGAARGGIISVKVDASSGSDPAATILSRILSALSTAYPHLSEEAVYAGGDPVKMARAAGERLNDLRRQLDAERQSLDELSGRRARLAETVLFDTPGSQIETYARQNRGRIETRLRAFGLPSNDPIATYKTLVRETAETGAGASRIGMTLRALWGFKGQGRLIALAAFLVLLGWGSGYMADNQDAVLTWLQSFGPRMSGATDWLQAHADWLAPLSHAAYALAALAVLVDIVRAIRFLQPVFRGVSLLTGDLDGRRRDLDSMLAHQTRRIDHVTSEVEAAVRTADGAERRVEARKAAGLLQPTLALGGGDAASATSAYDTADAVLAGISDAITGTASTMASKTAEPPVVAAAPERIVVGIDELDRLSPAAAATYLETAQRLLRRPNFVTVAAFERGHVLSGFSETDPGLASARLNRCVQLSYDLDADDSATAALGAAPPISGAGAGLTGSELHRPWSEMDAGLVRVLTPFAGPNPRNIKRFVNSFRVARADPKLLGASEADIAALAVALALDGHGSGIEFGSYDDGRLDPESGVRPQSDLERALSAAEGVVGTPLRSAETQRGQMVAKIFSRHG